MAFDSEGNFIPDDDTDNPFLNVDDGFTTDEDTGLRYRDNGDGTFYILDPEGNQYVVDGDGNVVSQNGQPVQDDGYTGQPDQDGWIHASNGVYYKDNGDGTYAIRDQDGTQYQVDGEGNVTSTTPAQQTAPAPAPARGLTVPGATSPVAGGATNGPIPTPSPAPAGGITLPPVTVTASRIPKYDAQEDGDAFGDKPINQPATSGSANDGNEGESQAIDYKNTHTMPTAEVPEITDDMRKAAEDEGGINNAGDTASDTVDMKGDSNLPKYTDTSGSSSKPSSDGKTPSTSSKPNPWAGAMGVMGLGYLAKKIADMNNGVDSEKMDLGDLDSAFNPTSVGKQSWDDWLKNKDSLNQGLGDLTSTIKGYQSGLQGISDGYAHAMDGWQDDYNTLKTQTNSLGQGMIGAADSADGDINPLRDFVKKLGDQGYIDQQKSQAMEDQGALNEQAMGQINRANAARGAGSGMSAALIADQAFRNAQAKMAAATGKENSLFSQYGQSAGQLGQLGIQNAANKVNARKAYQDGLVNVAGIGLKGIDTANNARLGQMNTMKVGSDMAQLPLTYGLKVAEAGNNAATTAGNLYANTANARTNAYNANTQRINTNNNGITDIGKGFGWAFNHGDDISAAAGSAWDGVNNAWDKVKNFDWSSLGGGSDNTNTP